MEKKQLETSVEEQYLQKTLDIAKQQLNQAKNAAEEKKLGIAQIKQEARENATHSITNLYDADDFEALAEFSQYTNAVNEGILDYEEEKRKISRLEHFIRCPYFARIDFQFEDEEQAEKIYIGRSSLTQRSTGDIFVYDWRSPIASVFYRFMSGKAYYDAPNGKIEGTVNLKRQYEIKDSVLKYFFDMDMNISDEILRQMLSKNTSPKMKAIVETIQKEQDIVIRDMENDLLMVQGVAGSGKTSIALHRAAYLMYQGLQTKLPANRILILSPNNAFEQYISDVLPELGEENVNSAVFEDLLVNILKDRQVQPKHEFLEQIVANHEDSEIVKQSMEFKMSDCFRDILERFLEDIPLQWIAFHDIYYDGECVADVQLMRDWVLQRPDAPLGVRLEQLEEYVLEQIFGTMKKKQDAEERNRIKQEIQHFTQLDVILLYRNLFLDKGYFEHLAGSIDAPWADRIWKYTRENLQAGRLTYDDAIVSAYLYLRIYGVDDYRNIRQVVIDEAQDYYPLQYEMFRLLFTNAKFTILGDMNQTLAKEENLSLYQNIQDILDKKKASLITLDKSFRCTNEILKFSLQFIEQKPQIDSFNRSGDYPKVVAADSYLALQDAVVQEISLCQEKGYQTICLICKTMKNAERLYADLKTRTDICLVTDSGMESAQGTFLMPVYMSKGLEFDAVIICDADTKNYRNKEDQKLLYVECTRALHRLSLIGEGETIAV